MSGHAEYFAIKAVSWSLLKEMQKSAAHFHHRQTHPLEDTPAMRLGRATHTAVLEPDKLIREWTVYDGARRGNAWLEFAAVNASKSILTPDEWDRVIGIRDAVRGDRTARRLLRRARTEVTVTWTDPETRIRCKARPDLISWGGLTDLKTTRDVDPRKFGRLATDMGYVHQLAFYSAGLAAIGKPVSHHHILAVESEAPHDVVVYDVGEDELWAAGVDVRDLLAQVKECRRKRRWPGRFETSQPLDVPPWFFAAAENDETMILEGWKVKS